MSTMRLKNKDGTWDKVPVLGSYQAVLAANEAATNAQNAADEAERWASTIPFITPQMYGAYSDGTHIEETTKAFIDALAYIEEQQKYSDFNDYTPSHVYGGIKLYIPNGIYAINRELVIPNGTCFEGESLDGTVLKFINTYYGVSLKGASYNGLRIFRNGNIKNFKIVMDGQGIGLSNVHYSETETNNNSMGNCVIEEITVTNADIGVIIQGAWNCIFKHIVCETCCFGFINDRNAYNGGNNNNRYINIISTSCTENGLWSSSAGSYFELLDIELIGNAWQGTFEGKSITLNGKEYKVPKPCAVYLTGKFTGKFFAPWFERLSEVNETEVLAFFIDNMALSSKNIPLSQIEIENPHFNNDVYNPIEIASECYFCLCSPIWGRTDKNLAKLTSATLNYGTYVFNYLNISLAKSIFVTNKSNYNTIIFENISDFGSAGRYDTYFNSDIKYYAIRKEKYVYPSNSSHDCDYIKNFSASDDTVYELFNSNKIIGYSYGRGCIRLPRNCGTITIDAGANSATITSYNSNLKNAVVLLSATNEAAATAIAGGYYISSQDYSNNITITFNNAMTGEATFNYFTISA